MSTEEAIYTVCESGPGLHVAGSLREDGTLTLHLMVAGDVMHQFRATVRREDLNLLINVAGRLKEYAENGE